MKHEYLIDLLKSNKTVIIPNIGALSNSDSPAHQYIFNEYLKFDDGMIVKYISTKEGISLDAAGDDLDKFTQGFADLLNQGKEVVIPQIGILSRVDGKTVFHCDTNASSSSKEIIPPIVEEKATPIIEKKPEPIIEKKSELVIEKKPDPIIPLKVDESKLETQNSKPETKPVIEKKPVTLSSDSVSKGKTPNPKRKRKLVWIILLILLLGGGGTAGFIFKDKIMEMVGMNETTAKNEEAKESDSKDQDKEDPKEEVVAEPEPIDENITEETNENTESAVVEETVEEPVAEEKIEETVKEEIKEPVQVASSSLGNYYIIVGCYSNQTNADNMISKISSAGMSPVNVGTFNSLIHVAASSASDMQGALQQLNTVRGTFPSAWILKQ